MNIYEKLQHCRVELQNSGLQKSGHNKFSGYDYFELGDFLPKTQELFLHVGLCGIIAFDKDYATLTITDISKPDDKIVITSPAADATLKGCHPIQNLGAAETYQRRYLWATAMEICEKDVIDNSDTSAKTGPVGNQTGAPANNANKQNESAKTSSGGNAEGRKAGSPPTTDKITKGQIAEIFKLGDEEKAATPGFDMLEYLARMEEGGRISTRYPYSDKTKTRINWTKSDYTALKDDLELPF